MTAWGSIEGAVEAMRRGARDYIEKPWDNNRLLHQLRTQIALGAALRKGQRLESENLTLRRDGAPELIASSPAMQRSEERRVGKECRSRWAPDHQKKNNEKEEIRATRG